MWIVELCELGSREAAFSIPESSSSTVVAASFEEVPAVGSASLSR
jgi:hypothetical protein